MTLTTTTKELCLLLLTTMPSFQLSLTPLRPPPPQSSSTSGYLPPPREPPSAPRLCSASPSLPPRLSPSQLAFTTGSSPALPRTPPSPTREATESNEGKFEFGRTGTCIAGISAEKERGERDQRSVVNSVGRVRVGIDKSGWLGGLRREVRDQN